jgi:hypothetical protein
MPELQPRDVGVIPRFRKCIKISEDASACASHPSICENLSALNIAYEQTGPDSCSPILLLHGFPYDVRECENTTFVREYVCERLQSSGLEIDAEANRNLLDIEGRLSTDTSKIAVWVIPTEEALQIAHEMLPGVKDLEAGDTRGHWFWPGNHLLASKLRGFSRFQEGRLCRHRE